MRAAIADWIRRRYGAGVASDEARGILPCNGSREGLFMRRFRPSGRKRLADGVRSAIVMCNPYYAAYIGLPSPPMQNPSYLNATEARGICRTLKSSLPMRSYSRDAAFYLCSPANPQGAVASAEYIAKALALARAHDFMLFFDECYSEIYSKDAPTGGLQVAADTPEGFANLVVFNSLSKRSNLPGLRSGFCAGDPDFLDKLTGIRNLIGPQMPGPVQHASAAIWAEEQHVGANRQRYRAKFDVCDQVLGQRIWLPQAGWRVLPLARCEPFWWRRRRYGNPMATHRCQSSAWRIPGAGRFRRHQSPAQTMCAWRWCRMKQRSGMRSTEL